MAKTTIKVEGLRELRSSLRDARNKAPDEFKRIHRELGDKMASQARGRVPVKSGKLKDTIKGSGTKTAARVQFGAKGMEYAGPVHYGGYPEGWQGDPFMLEPFESGKDQMMREYVDEVKDLLDNLDTKTR